MIICFFVYNIVAAFRGMHVSPAKHSYAWLQRKCDYRTDTQMDGRTDARQSDPYVQLCFAGDTKTREVRVSINLCLVIPDHDVVSAGYGVFRRARHSPSWLGCQECSGTESRADKDYRLWTGQTVRLQWGRVSRIGGKGKAQIVSLGSMF